MSDKPTDPMAATVSVPESALAMAATAAGRQLHIGGSDNTLLPKGAMAGDYRIVRRLGGGAMGDVYEGEAVIIGKRVAIKVIKHLYAASAEAAERFVREARAVNRIDNPHVPDVFAFGKLDDGRLYLVMDLLLGQSLGDRLRTGGGMGADEFVAVMEPICEAVDAAHKAGVIHRDLKPDNVFLAEQAGGMHVYVLDFGIAKMLADAANDKQQVTLTGDGVWIGTPAYMSPEQWAADPATPQTDVYSLGCMAHEMLTGDVPYKADSVPGIMQKHFNADPPRLDREPTSHELPGAFGEAIAIALAKEPTDRQGSATEFYAELLSGKQDSLPASRRLVPIMAAGLGIAVVAALAFLLLNGLPERTAVGTSEGLASDESSTASTNTSTPDGSGPWSLVVNADPPTAILSAPGRGETRGVLHLNNVADEAALTVHAKAPGFVSVDRRYSRKDRGKTTLSLEPVLSFEGSWRLEDGRIQAFERSGSKQDGWGVAVFNAPEGEDPQFLRVFRFIDAGEGFVRFAASVKYVDPRAPSESSCQFGLSSEYRFHAARETLELRRETAPISFRNGKCAVGTRVRLAWEPATRVAHDGEVRWAVARGGRTLKSYIVANPRPVVLQPPARTLPKDQQQKTAIGAAGDVNGVGGGNVADNVAGNLDGEPLENTAGDGDSNVKPRTKGRGKEKSKPPAQQQTQQVQQKK